MRRETVLGRTAHERHVEIITFIAFERGELLARTRHQRITPSR